MSENTLPVVETTTTAPSRRKFLTQSSAAILGAAALSVAEARAQPGQATPPPNTPPPGSPSAFGTSPAVGPEVTAETFAQAGKLVQYEMTPKDAAEAAGNWRVSMAPLYERRVGPRKVEIPDSVAPATTWNPAIPQAAEQANKYRTMGGFEYTLPQDTPLPSDDAAIAYSSVAQLAAWMRDRKITSERLTRIYIDRIKRYNPKLRCVITLTEEHAMQQARQADAEIAAGKWRGPLHGIPWGGKDLLDTAGIPTTWGAEFNRNRVPKEDAAVVRKLNEAGAVLIAKLSLGALALNDVWFGGQTMNPWLLEEGASGSSAGPGSATASGLVAFSIGSETGGSIVSPSMRNGVTGLRPTYGRVPRTGAMTLCWTLDKLGPMTRYVEDAMLVLDAISGYDPGDMESVPSKLHFNGGASVRGLRVGYFPQWMKEAPATDVDRASLAKLKELGCDLVEVSLPDWPYDSLNLMLFAEGGAAFERITLDHEVDQLKMQVPDAWPNSFRQARFLSAVDFMQTDRFRRMVAVEMARIMNSVDLLFVPSLRDEMLVISNNTGHPSLTLRTGFVEVSEARSDWAPDPAHPLPHFSPPRRVPHGITLIGRLFDEGTIAEVGMALQNAMNAAKERPQGF